MAHWIIYQKQWNPFNFFLYLKKEELEEKNLLKSPSSSEDSQNLSSLHFTETGWCERAGGWEKSLLKYKFAVIWVEGVGRWMDDFSQRTWTVEENKNERGDTVFYVLFRWGKPWRWRAHTVFTKTRDGVRSGTLFRVRVFAGFSFLYIHASKALKIRISEKVKGFAGLVVCVKSL